MEKVYKIRHISHSDLDGYGCTILSHFFEDLINRGNYGFQVDFDTWNIPPTRLPNLIKSSVCDIVDQLDYVIITDLVVNDTLLKPILDCPLSNKFYIIDHHEIDLSRAPANITIQTNGICGPTCATELYLNALANAIGMHTLPSNLLSFVRYVRLYDTYEFYTAPEPKPEGYSIPPKLNILFHILDKTVFMEYILDFLHSEDPTESLLCATEKYPYIPYLIDIERSRIEWYVTDAACHAMKTQFNIGVMTPSGLVKFDYPCAVVFAERNGPLIGRRVCEQNLDIVFCVVVSHNRVSLYTDRDDINVADIAKALGGGGHRKASGFSIPHDVSSNLELNRFIDMVKYAARHQMSNLKET